MLAPTIGAAPDVEAPRLLPSAELPNYTYTPGSDTPHPIRDPRGHSHNRKGKTSKPLVPEQWADNRLFRPLSEYTGRPYGQKWVPIEER